MCGIAGIISSNTSLVTKEKLRSMTDTIAHRGPDGESHWINNSGNAGLGHRRLAIIDLSESAAQPMHYLNRYSIVHNGEIYNYKEIKETLIKKGYIFYTQSDTEVILAAYDCYRHECLGHFDGMFAFAIWDEKEQILFAARDRFGEKPFYYFLDGEQFLFASEMKALWAAGVSKEPDLKMWFNYITLGYTLNPGNPYQTFYRGIQKLPGRHFLELHLPSFDLTQSHYWDIEINKTINIDREKAMEQFSELFSNSIRKRLRSDVPIGTSLSGGLDSSSVVAICRKINSTTDSQKTFSCFFPGFEKDEKKYVEKLLTKFPVTNFSATPVSAELVQDFEKLCYHQEEPFQSSSIYAQYSVYKLAAENGIKVLLDGQGADETIAGYEKYYSWYWRELYKSDKKLLKREIEAANKLGVNLKFDWKNRMASDFPVIAGLIWQNKKKNQQKTHPYLTKDFISEYGESYYSLPHFHNLNGVLYYNTFMNGLEELLRYADRSSMAHGREVRLPFLNHELVEFIFSLPPNFKIKDGWTKWIERVSMENLLPSEITWRKDKTGFEPPQKVWMSSTEMNDLYIESLRVLVKKKILTYEILNKKIQPQDAHAADNSDWRYVTTGVFLKTCFS